MDSNIFKKYMPIMLMDEKEPFYPRAIGCSLMRETQTSPSFGREIKVTKEVKMVLEYAIYWDYDIQHLYDLEHIWVYVDDEDKVIDCEASFHGKYFRGLLRDRSNLRDNQHVVLYCQPGKHAFAPSTLLFELLANYESCTTTQAGSEGLCDTKICEGRVASSHAEDKKIQAYLKTCAFVPTEKYIPWKMKGDLLMTWQELYDNIPNYVRTCIDELL